MAKSGLGRGLSALIPEVSKEENDNIELELSKIYPNADQPRASFDEEKITSLSESIEKYGVLQPIVVSKSDSDKYMIVAGERRWRAAKKVGLDKIPAVIKEFSSREIAEIALIENIQREDLNVIEEAVGYNELLTKFSLTQKELSDAVGKSRSHITNLLRLLKLEDKIQESLINNKIKMGHARALLGIDDSKLRLKVLQLIIDKNLSVRNVEKKIKNLQAKNDTKTQKNKKRKTKEVVYYESELKNFFGTNVNINGSDKKGKIEIEYYGTEDLNRILELIDLEL